MEKKWYFKYNPQTFEFIPGAILAEKQPENTTDIEPTGFYGLPKWNESDHKWEGQSLPDWLQEQKANDINQVDSDKQMLSSLMTTMMKQEMRIQQLEAEQSGGAK
ncbi:hypothetical protein FFRU_160070 [Fructobacillus fructosus]|uniref:Uncharacterized protein n=1 Tax=Fructobacillus fructosus TaxID=1631 RepID=A0ABM9MT30_9LACO|nr:hypothetical protein [Fructobacillus fructosus]KRN52130.1 hypothetical protein IV71_GL000279 [Fructobacillus fructosus KCTC 3544]GAP01913.1 hypothetical protein FFRU_160070 [Fructobacillus fructosus]CAK1237507.1 unnamed protein product [Fructobacillus fructosus]